MLKLGNFAFVDLRSFLEKYSQGKSISLLCETVNKQHNQLISVSGVHGSAYATIAAALYEKKSTSSFIMCILNDEDEAGYFYQDLKALLKNSSDVMFYPSSYRLRGGKYIKDEENGILRTEALGKIIAGNGPFLLVSYPEAVAEKVSDKKKLAGNYEKISAGDAIDISELEKKLLGWGFRNVDYVYQPGEFAIRGSIVDVFSFSSNNPFRLDFFGDEISSIRSFDIRTQLSIDKQEYIILAPQT